MPELEPVVYLIVGVVIVNGIAGRIGIPAPILLVMGGLGVSFIPGTPDYQVNPELVLTVLLPPLLYAAAVAVATVYGRYHYTADAVAGIAMGALAYAAGAWLMKRRVPGTAAPPPATAHSLSTRTSGPGCP